MAKGVLIVAPSSTPGFAELTVLLRRGGIESEWHTPGEFLCDCFPLALADMDKRLDEIVVLDAYPGQEKIRKAVECILDDVPGRKWHIVSGFFSPEVVAEEILEAAA